MSIKHPLVDSKYRLSALSETAIINLKEQTITYDKANRWVGFIQGVLIANGITTVENERDYTRPLFQSYYKSCGITQDRIDAN